MAATNLGATSPQLAAARYARQDFGPIPATAPQRHFRLIDRVNQLRLAGTVLQLGAHPDDEDGGMIAYMSRRHGARVIYWSATRGEGGQNRRGPERGEALGVVRTWESLDARVIDAGEVLYGPFYDFGFCKSGDDALRRWDSEDLLREMVRAIRLAQPLVVIGRWSGGPSDGHGHHQAIGMLTSEAFEAAGDASRFPELGLAPWQAQKLYRSVAGDWQPGEDASFGVIVDEYEAAGHLRINTGLLDEVAGRSYQEQAHLALNRHRSQGMGFMPEPGSYYFYYRLERSLAPIGAEREQTFYDGLDPLLTGLADHPAGAWPEARERMQGVVSGVDQALERFRPKDPGRALEGLFDALAALRGARAQLSAAPLDHDARAALDAYLTLREVDFESVIAACLQLRTECLADRPRATPSSDLGLAVQTWNGGRQDVEVTGVRLGVPPEWIVTPLDHPALPAHPTTGDAHVARYQVTISAQEPPRAPYWLRAPRERYRYVWPDASPALGLALDEPLVWSEVHVRVGEHALTLRSPAVYRSAFAGGSRELGLSILPSVAVEPRDRRALLPASADPATVQVAATVRRVDPSAGQARLSLAVPPDWLVEPATLDLPFGGPGDTHSVRQRVTIPGGALPGDYELRHEVTVGNRVEGVEVQSVRVGANGASVSESTCVSEAHLVRPAGVAVQLVDATFVRSLRYAYVRGLDEDVVASLSRFELDFTELSDDELAFAELGDFDAIVVGPNAYNARPSLRANADRLLEYVGSGGTLIVQYQTYGYDQGKLTPYPFRYHQPHDRVTDPLAAVTILDRDHPIMHVPNRIEAADFDGWVHDRGLYFFGEWDRRYVPILSCHDVGEEPRAGGLLSCSYGRGTYVYAAYSFFRQIPAGVAGAVRLFANLLGLAEARLQERMTRLRPLELFSFMTDEQLHETARIVSERWVDAGTYIAQQGDPAHELFVLLDGAIEVVKTIAGGETRTINQVHPPATLGELAVLAGTTRSASLKAATDAVVLVLPAETFHEWLKNHPDLSRALLRRLAEQIIARDPDR